MTPRRGLRALLLAVVLLMLVLVVEALLASRGRREPFGNPSRMPRVLGEAGPALTYAVIGDSTSAGQGADYERGIALATARHLARERRVTLVNASISGARAADVAAEQVELAAGVRPDVALLAFGANDVIRLTSLGALRDTAEMTVERLVAANCDVKIVLTGAPEMGAVPRFAQPLRWVAGLRTRQVNRTIGAIVAQRELTLAPIAEQTGPLFARDPGLFAADRFHPNDRGYATWAPVLTHALDQALTRQPSHCGR